MRLDAIDAELGVENKTPRTIEGPLYVAGAPVEQGFARIDDGSDTDGNPPVLTGTVYDADGQQIGSASCRESVCQYEQGTVVSVILNTKTSAQRTRERRTI